MDIGNDNPLVKSAIVCPPDIYGQSSSSGTRSTFLVPLYVECLMRGVPPFYLGAGENIRAVTHLQDVVDLFVLLVDQALQGGGNATWGKDVSLIISLLLSILLFLAILVPAHLNFHFFLSDFNYYPSTFFSSSCQDFLFQLFSWVVGLTNLIGLLLRSQ